MDREKKREETRKKKGLSAEANGMDAGAGGVQVCSSCCSS